MIRTVYDILSEGRCFTKSKCQNMKKSVLGYPRSKTDFCVFKWNYQLLQYIFVKISRTEVDYIRADLERRKDKQYPSKKKKNNLKPDIYWMLKGTEIILENHKQH